MKLYVVLFIVGAVLVVQANTLTSKPSHQAHTHFPQKPSTRSPLASRRPHTHFPPQTSTRSRLASRRPHTHFPPQTTTRSPFASRRPHTHFPPQTTTRSPLASRRPHTHFPPQTTTRSPLASRRPHTHFPPQTTTRSPFASRRPHTHFPPQTTTRSPLASRRPHTHFPPQTTTRSPHTHRPFGSRPTIDQRTRFPGTVLPTRVPLKKCSSARDCSRWECCVTQTILPYKRGVCQAMGREGRQCNTDEDSVLANGMYLKHCPCARGLECVAEKTRVIPNIGEVKINERCTSGSTTARL